ncbi:MAG: bifunctional diaminohydroxyphosphoribosylaminopyrimidine deaminase/5-amino-6-(5-phosphoribosylamino)uracil reductase RibD [Deltaproteobacteria bacterium]|nr:bifunctional diaminohydroxyphosphoribosylaminopyrimidine deaminase/5-amino-6-(5-phosphoribosylamino)uracil reductase RibD [Deltaproteobacteria bacterium]
MKRAINLAKKGDGWVSPNPMVGAVIVKDGHIIGEGYHRKYGGHHAEINAINNASVSTEGATFYITLEPCTHYGKTPPCIDRVVASRPARVVVGVSDPNPAVSGKGLKILRDSGIETIVDLLKEECIKLNERYFKFTTTGVPFVTLKYAQTFDGRIASGTGHSKWISSKVSLKFAHKLRSCHDAVMVGIGTVLADDPDLRPRLVKGNYPIRIVVDSHLKIPPNARILNNQGDSKTIIISSTRHSEDNLSRLKDMGIETIIIPEHGENLIDLEACLTKLGERGISSILVEGGSKMITSFMKKRLVDKLIAITAPRIMGTGVEAVGNLDIMTVDDSIRLDILKISRKGSDIIVEAALEK